MVIAALPLLLGQSAEAQSPGGVAGATAWFKVDDGLTLSGTTVTAWANKATSAAFTSLTPSTGFVGTLTTNNPGPFNFNSYITGNGSNIGFVSPTLASPATNVVPVTQGTIIGVGVSPDLITSYYSVSTASPCSNNRSNTGIRTGGFQFAGTQVNWPAASVANVANTWGGYAGTAGQAAVNNGVYTTSATAAGSRCGSDYIYSVGGFPGSAYSDKLAESITFNTALSSTDYNKVESYLGIKYGITLGHDYLNSSGNAVYTISGYANNIAGIARDNTSALYQKQSKSIKTGNQVVISLGTVAATNAANTGALTDQQFLVWGDDGATGTTAVGSGSNIISRLNKWYRVENTGTVGQVTVYYPSAAFTTSLPHALITNTSANATGAGITVLTTATTSIGGVSYVSASYTFPPGVTYFTFGDVAVPGGVAGAALWVKADENTALTDGTAKTMLTNQSGTIHLAGTCTYENDATNSVNFNPVMSFNGTSDKFTAQGILSGSVTGATHFGVASSTNTGNVLFNYGQGASANRIIVNLPWTGDNVIHDFAKNAAGSGRAVTTNSYATAYGGKTNLWTFDHGPTASNDSTSIFYNSSVVAYTLNSATPAAFNAAAYNGFALGYTTDGTGGNYFAGNVSEYLSYGTHLTGAQRARVESYLAIKYGQTLSRNYIASDGTTATFAIAGYGNNVAGIGRDDATALLQKQSRSVNTGNQVVMSLGPIAATNTANTGTFPADKQFLIWGDDGATGTTAVATGSIATRFAKWYKIQNTGSVAQAITVYYPSAAFTSGLAHVLITNGTASTAGAANTALSTTTTSINGVTYYSATFTFPAGTSYFTFGDLSAPGGVNGAALWVKADDGTAAGTRTTWVNQSGSTNLTGTGTQSTATGNLVNFNPVVSFSPGSGNRFSATGLLNGTIAGATHFGVARSNNAQNALFNYGQATTGNRITAQLPWSDNTVIHDFALAQSASGANRAQTAASFSATYSGKDLLWSFDHEPAATTGITAIYANGLLVASTPNSATPATFNSNTDNGFALGSTAAATNYFDGTMGEFISYGTSLTAAQRQQVESYLALKYGQTLSHNYVASDGTIATYTIAGYGNNVAGIGRDDATTLLQKQSRSVNTGNQVVMSLGPIAATNTANTGTFPADKQFLVWGDDGATGTTAIGNGSIIVSSFTKWYRVEHTGNVGQVTVYYPGAAFAGTLPHALIANTSASITGANVMVLSSATTSIGGTNYVSTTYTFPAGVSYFTFGDIAAPGGIAGAIAWTRADIGATTTGWANVADPANNYTKMGAGTPTITTAGVNFNPDVTFPGNVSYVSAANIPTASNGDYSKFVAFKLTGNGINNLSSSYDASGAAFFADGTQSLYIKHNGALLLPAYNTNTANLYAIGTVAMDYGVADVSFIKVNGVLKRSGTVNASYTAGRSQLGNNGPGVGDYLIGSIAESIIYPTAFANYSGWDIGRIESYLALKYGVTLASGYIASEGFLVTYETTSYRNNVAGIGRDDGTALLQKQSRSVNPGDQVVMSLGPVAASNAANASAFTANNQFLIWGDDGAAGTTFVRTNIATRLAKWHKIQNTGNITQAVTVYYPSSAFNAILPHALITNSTASTTNATITLLTTTTAIDGVPYYSTTYTFPPGISYFTFGDLSIPGGVAGAALWLRADNGVVETGANVSSWINQVTEPMTTQPSKAPTSDVKLTAVGLNYNPVVTYSGANNQVLQGLFASAPNSMQTIFATARQLSGSGGNVFSNAAEGSAGILTNGAAYTIDGNGVSCAPTSSAYDVPYVVRAGYTSAISAAGATTSLNGLLNAACGGTLPLNAATGGFQIGGRTWAGNTAGGYPARVFKGDIGEVIMFNNNALTGLQQLQVESYLAIKYGITLTNDNNGNGIPNEALTGFREGDYVASDGTTRFWNGLANAGFHNNIAGIGSDAAGGLNQKQSRSANNTPAANGKNMITMGTNIANSNADNNNIFFYDKSFLVWGDDAGSIASFTRTGLPTSLTSPCAGRLGRTWKIQRTGNTTSYTMMSVDLSNTVMPGGIDVMNDVKLIIDQDGDGVFTTGTQNIVPAGYYNSTTKEVFFFPVWDIGNDGADAFTIAINPANTSYPPALVAAGTTAGAPATGCRDASGYQQFVDDATTPTMKYMAIKATTGTATTAASVSIVNTTAATAGTRTSGSGPTAYATVLGRRMYTVPSGSATSGSTYTVRIYYSPADTVAAVNAAIAAAGTGAVNKGSKWFKYEGTAAQATAAQVGAPTGFSNGTPTFYKSPTYGLEGTMNYVEISGVTSFSTFGFLAAAGAPGTIPLPVKLESFDGAVDNCTATLTWKTGTEQNSDHYEIEHSTDARTFKQVGNVKSRNSITGSSYTFGYPELTSGQHSFRLKMVDNNGAYDYSKTIVLRSNCEGKGDISVWPNPATSAVRISGLSGKSRIHVISATGQTVDTIETIDAWVELDLSRFANGVYLIRVEGRNNGNVKVLKQ